MNVESTGRNLFMPISKAWHSTQYILWVSPIPNFDEKFTKYDQNCVMSLSNVWILSLTFTKLTITQQHYTDIFCTEFYPDQL
jgi:hypothetical protein